MATTIDEVYIKVGLDTKQFDSSIQGMRKEMAYLRGQIGRSIYSEQDNAILKKRFGDLKDEFDDVRASAMNVQTGDVFGNMARFAGVAANAVAGVTAATSLLGIKSKEAGAIQQKILEFMAIGNALQALADSKRLGALAKEYAMMIKNFFVRKEMVATEQAYTNAIDKNSQALNNNTSQAASNLAATANMTKAQYDAINAQITYTKLIDDEVASFKELIGDQEATIEQLKNTRDATLAAGGSVTELDRNINFLTADLVDLKNGQQEFIAKSEAISKAQAKGITTTSGMIKALREMGYTVDKTGAILDKVTGQQVGQFSGKISATSKIISFLPAGFQAAGTAAVNFGRTLLVSLGWMAAIALAIMAVIWAFDKLFLAESKQKQAQKEVQDAIKGTVAAIKELQKANDDLYNQIGRNINDMGALNDKILQQQGLMTETQVQRNALYRKYNGELKNANEKLVKDLQELNTKYREGDIKSEALYLALKKSLNLNYSIYINNKANELDKELKLIDLEGKKAAAEKAKAAYEARIALEISLREKLVSIWKETWDQYNRLVISMYENKEGLKNLQRTQEINNKRLAIDKKYFSDLKAIQADNQFGDLTFEDYSKALLIHKNYVDASKQLVIDELDYKIQETIAANNVTRQNNKFTYDKEIQALDDKVKANKESQDKLLEIQKKASTKIDRKTGKSQADLVKEDLIKVNENTEILSRTRTALTTDFNSKQEKLVKDQAVKIENITNETNKNVRELDTKFLDDRIKLWSSKISLQNNIISTSQASEALPNATWAQVKLQREFQIKTLNDLKQSYTEVYNAQMAMIQQTMTGEEQAMAEASAMDDLTNSINGVTTAIYDLETKKPADNFSKGWDAKVIGRDFKDNWLSYMQEIASKTSELMNASIDAFIQSNQIKTEIAIKNIEEQLTQEVANLTRLKDEKLISDKQYADKVAAAEKQAAEQTKRLKREQFQKEKQASILKAIIGGALAVVQAYASAGNPILGAIFAALTAGIVATQIGMIAKQPVPEYGKGGYVYGPSHPNGGVKAEMEGGEYVIKREVAQRPGMSEVLTNINNSKTTSNAESISNSTYTNIKRDAFTYNTFQEGGFVIDKTTPTNSTAGNIFNSKENAVSTTTNYNNSLSKDDIRTIVAEVVLGAKSIPVVVSEVDITKTQRKVSAIETRSRW